MVTRYIFPSSSISLVVKTPLLKYKSVTLNVKLYLRTPPSVAGNIKLFFTENSIWHQMIPFNSILDRIA